MAAGAAQKDKDFSREKNKNPKIRNPVAPGGHWVVSFSNYKEAGPLGTRVLDEDHHPRLCLCESGTILEHRTPFPFIYVDVSLMMPQIIVTLPGRESASISYRLPPSP